jgi:hypothetical protein
MIVENFIKNNFVDYDINYFTNRIINKNYFSYSRFNDGELFCVIKQVDNDLEKNLIKNCDSHEYIPTMGIELLSSLKNSDNEKYFIQYLESWILNEKGTKYSEILIKNNYLTGKYQYSDFLQKSLRNNPDEFKKFVEVLNQNKIIIVGPKYLSNIKFINYENFIEVPIVNCYNDKKNIVESIKNNLKDDTIVLFSSSMATNVFIDEIFKYNDKCFLIDIGSLWDIFFHEKNPEIIQRKINLSKLETFKKYYKDYF